MKIEIFDCLVRRDAQTTTPVQVGMHEVAVLQTIYGEESVVVGKKILIDGKPFEREIGDGEYERLCQNYGVDLIEKVYGAKATGRFDETLAKYAVKDGVKKADKNGTTE